LQDAFEFEPDPAYIGWQGAPATGGKEHRLIRVELSRLS
jgi:hypothetical protein